MYQLSSRLDAGLIGSTAAVNSGRFGKWANAGHTMPRSIALACWIDGGGGSYARLLMYLYHHAHSPPFGPRDNRLDTHGSISGTIVLHNVSEPNKWKARKGPRC